MVNEITLLYLKNPCACLKVCCRLTVQEGGYPHNTSERFPLTLHTGARAHTHKVYILVMT